MIALCIIQNGVFRGPDLEKDMAVLTSFGPEEKLLYPVPPDRCRCYLVVHWNARTQEKQYPCKFCKVDDWR